MSAKLLLCIVLLVSISAYAGDQTDKHTIQSLPKEMPKTVEVEYKEMQRLMQTFKNYKDKIDQLEEQIKKQEQELETRSCRV